MAEGTPLDPRPQGCRDCADSDGFCCNDPNGPNCGFAVGHPMHRPEPFRPATQAYGESTEVPKP